MKNLLLVTQGFPYGETERGFLPTEYETLSRHFHLTVLSFGTTDPLLYPVVEGVDHRRYDWGGGLSPMGLLGQFGRKEVRQDITKAFKDSLPMFPKRAARILAYSYRAQQVTELLRQLIIEKKIDIVYTYWCIQTTIAALRLKREFPNLKVVTRFHGMDLYPEQTAENWEPLLPYVAANADQLLFVSQLGRQFFLDNWGQQWADKTVVSYIGCRSLPCIEADSNETLVLVSCSSLISIKQVNRIIDGLACLPEDFPVHWHHFGNGELEETLKNQAAEQLSGRPALQYTFHGYVQNTQLPQLYQQIGAQLFITTSETEGLPVSMMEAYAMGMPVIATAVGGIPEMVQEGENGFLLPNHPEGDQVAQAIQCYAALSLEEKERMSQRALASWQEHFDAAANAEKLMPLLAQQ